MVFLCVCEKFSAWNEGSPLRNDMMASAWLRTAACLSSSLIFGALLVSADTKEKERGKLSCERKQGTKAEKASDYSVAVRRYVRQERREKRRERGGR